MAKTVEEIRAAFAKFLEEDLKRAETTFEGIDSKGKKDGKITAADFKHEAAFKGFGGKYDENNDAEVTKDEYLNAVAVDKLGKKLSVEDYDLEGADGRTELYDFKRAIEGGLGFDLKKEDEVTLVKILEAASASKDVGVEYPVFKVKLHEMYNNTVLYGQDDAATALLNSCKEKLAASADQEAACEKEFNGIDKSKNGVIEIKDFPNCADMAVIMRKVKGKDEGVSDESFISKREFMEFNLLKSWDAVMEKANGSLPERVDKELFLKFVTEGGVSADAENVEKVYIRMPAKEYSVENKAFNIFLAQFALGQVMKD